MAEISQTKPEDFVILLNSESMGSGNDELGKILLRSFLNTLIKQEQLPTHIILYNTGVLLAINETDTANSLNELEQLGVEVILCGTCCDFFQIKEKIKAGCISNMMHISSTLIKAPKVIVP